MGFLDNRNNELIKKFIKETEVSEGVSFEEVIFEQLPHVSMRRSDDNEKILILFNFYPSFSETAIIWKSARIINLTGLTKFDLIVDKQISTVLTPISMYGTKVNNYVNVIKIEYENSEGINQINCLDAVSPVLVNNRMQLFINMMGIVKDNMAKFIVKIQEDNSQKTKSSNLEKLIEAKEMLDMKLITQEEFDKLKSRIIGE